MHWLFDNLQIVVVIAAAIATLITRAKQARDDRDVAENMPPAIPVDPDAELRRIREEVMRRRAEREGHPPVMPPQEQAPPPLLHDDTATDDDHPMRRDETEWQPQAPRPVVVATAPPPMPAREEREEDVLDRQRVLAEKLRELRAARDAASVTATAFAVSASPLTTHPAPQAPSLGLPFHPAALAADLRRSSEIRRAIVMAEVLGRPKGM
ncbi:hypothetical protein [Nibricoccus sp. IMCC34717]|uniref:hypothetical protein n=1 Tax=Nibricoccus sp. IMCC34717 TaxID=3034021 RepID=UPI00384F5D4E